MQPLVIFDLDGTLIDSRLDLAHSVNATLRKMQRPEIPVERVSAYVGNGAPVLVRRALGEPVTDAELERALAFFLDYYAAHKLDYTVLYPGVREGVEQLAGAGAALAVLTNKPVRISNAILEELGLARFFRQVYGGNSFEFKKPHPIGIETLISEAGSDRARTVMVGDSGVDVQTARNAGVTACGVTYGFQPETFADHPPDYLVDTIAEIAARI